MQHVVANPTWRCQLKCPFCWLPHSAIDPAGQEHDATDWGYALWRNLAPGSVVDFSGGEPLVYDGLVDVLEILGSKHIFWALTTNAVSARGIERLCESNAQWHCVQINVSVHAGNQHFAENAAKLQRAGFPVHFNRVQHEAEPNYPGAAQLPYQAWKEGAATDGLTRACTAGRNHWMADPQGNVYRCQVAMQKGLPPIGNLFKTWRLPAVSTPHVCDYGCSSCYTTNSAAWGIEMEALP